MGVSIIKLQEELDLYKQAFEKHDSELKLIKNNYKTESEEVLNLKNTLKENISSLEDEIDKAEMLNDKIESISNFQETIPDIQNEILENKTSIFDARKSINLKREEIENFYEDLEESKAKLQEQRDEYLSDKASRDELQLGLSKMLEGTTETSLWKSFKREADASKNSVWFLLLILFLTLGFFVSSNLIAYHIGYFNENPMIRSFVLNAVVLVVLFRIIAQINIKERISAEYRHKATLSEALIGYRRINKLNYENEEYLMFYEKVIGQLNKNPADKLDKSLKSEDIFDKLIKLSRNIIRARGLE